MTKQNENDEFDLKTLMKEGGEEQPIPEAPEAPIPDDPEVLKKGILTMLGDASKTSVSSVFGYLVGRNQGDLTKASGHEGMLDVIYDDLDALDLSGLSQVYIILSRFE